jgi:hypothetical protein
MDGERLPALISVGEPFLQEKGKNEVDLPDHLFTGAAMLPRKCESHDLYRSLFPGFWFSLLLS